MKVTYSELPLGLPDVVKSVPNNKLDQIRTMLRIMPNEDVQTAEQKVIELVYHLIELQVRPIKQYRQEEMSQNPDITDVIS
jgi:hypothetical protein